MALCAALLAGCAAEAAPAAGPVERLAERLAHVTSPHESTGMTLLEGPTLGPDGDLYLVDVTAPPGEPKVLRVDPGTGRVTPVYTDTTGAYTSAQFSPHDGRLYLTDILTGSILSITADGEDPATVFSGSVEGEPMAPDDLAFDQDGHLYVSDTTGHDSPTAEPAGRIVRIDRAGGEATVLADELPAPNGISFDEDFAGLWVSQYHGNRVDYLGLAEDGTAVASTHPAIHIDAGRGRVDSNAVDADGNVYQGFHGSPEIRVYDPRGTHLATITAPSTEGEPASATNLAIAPGSTDAYLTVSGPGGGFVYTFTALAPGIRQSNGG
ncbi:SMP-30/gluconolactonase/LRE family protein [Allonocardiopsis opalescens]|uniref:SMP-30/gluconolactonase/LRE family protein n=1 Tax=Allonocardiopsis opalescens TaxID=1144618 RepID=UPI003182C72B